MWLTQEREEEIKALTMGYEQLRRISANRVVLLSWVLEVDSRDNKMISMDGAMLMLWALEKEDENI